MMLDEEREEWERESRGVGEYAKGDPEKATGSPSSWRESVPGIPCPRCGLPTTAPKLHATWCKERKP